jgi:hypothetical protein
VLPSGAVAAEVRAAQEAPAAADPQQQQQQQQQQAAAAAGGGAGGSAPDVIYRVHVVRLGLVQQGALVRARAGATGAALAAAAREQLSRHYGEPQQVVLVAVELGGLTRSNMERALDEFEHERLSFRAVGPEDAAPSHDLLRSSGAHLLVVWLPKKPGKKVRAAVPPDLLL